MHINVTIVAANPAGHASICAALVATQLPAAASSVHCPCSLSASSCSVDGDCCRVALEAGDTQQLAALMDQNFDLRRQLFGDAAIGADNLRMIQTARSVGGRACTALALRWVDGPEQWGGSELGSCTGPLLSPALDPLCSQQPAAHTPCLHTGTGCLGLDQPLQGAGKLTVCTGTECCSLLPAAAAKFTGSGGAAVALCPEGVRQGEALQDACRKAGFECIQVQVGPPHSLPDMPDSHELPDALVCSDSQP